MALVIETFLICDVCSQSFGIDNRNDKGYIQRITARKKGWIYVGNKDYCPNCRAVKKDGTYPKSNVRKSS